MLPDPLTEAQPVAPNRWRAIFGADGWLARLRRFTLVRLVCGFFLVVVGVWIVQALGSRLPIDRALLRLPMTLLAVAVAVAGYRVFVRRVERRSPEEVGGASALPELTAGWLLGALLFCATMGLMMLAGAFRVDGWGDPGGMLVILCISIGAGTIEELLFRGVLFHVVESRWGSWVALTVSSALFGLVHLGNPGATWMSSLAITLEAGVMLGGAFLVTRRLWLPMGIHMAWNFTQGGIFGVAVSGVAASGLLRGTAQGPEWLTGGAFGAEASLPAVVAGASGAVVLLWIAHRRGHFRGKALPQG